MTTKTAPAINAKFVCDCGNTVIRPRGHPGHPQCLRCYNMQFIEDVEEDNDSTS